VAVHAVEHARTRLTLERTQETEELAPPGVGEVRVRVESIGMNFADVFTVLGMYDAAPAGQRIIPGLEFAGVVEEVGKAPKKKISKVGRSADGKRNVVVAGADTDAGDDFAGYPFRPGDRVMGVTRFGSYATHLNIGTSFIRKIPEYW
jgi:NADPH:quinone reductase-like Zn-dependent oxidoreductase